MVFTFASFAMVFSVSPSMIILLRVVQGIGAALIFGTSVAILTSVTPPGERGKALGIYTTAVYLGLSMGPFLGGFLTTSFGWRSIFLVNVPVGILILAIVRTKLEGEWADARGESFDISGALLYGLALVCVMFGFSLLPDVSGMVLVAAGTLVLATFLWWEHRTPSPLINLSLFLKNRVFAFSNLAALINYSATFSVTFFLSFYLQYIRGFSPAVAGTILVTQPVVQAVFSSYAGRLSDRIEPGRIASAGMTMTAVGLFLLSLLSADTPLTYLIGTLILLGLGFAFFSSPNTNAIMNSVAKPYYGVASRNPGNNAACRPDVVHGYCDGNHLSLHRPFHDYTVCQYPTSHEYQGRFHPLCPALLLRRLLLPGAGEIEGQLCRTLSGA